MIGYLIDVVQCFTILYFMYDSRILRRGVNSTWGKLVDLCEKHDGLCNHVDVEVHLIETAAKRQQGRIKILRDDVNRISKLLNKTRTDLNGRT